MQAHRPKSSPARSPETPQTGKGFDPSVNPYSTWVHEHPDTLLAEPSPEDLAARIAPAIAEGAQVVVDLGCGSGGYLLQAATMHPERIHIGFELRFKRLVKSARKIEKAGLDRVWFLRDLAEQFPRYFGPGQVWRVHVNFPDPWPKKGQWKKRLIQKPFLREVARTLAPGGRFCLKTDHSGYFLHVLEVIQGLPELRPRVCRNDLHRQDLYTEGIRTEFEGLFLSKNKPVYYLELEKPRNPAP